MRKEDLPSSVEDFGAADWMNATEWGVLAKHHEGEAWVWDRVAEHEAKQGDKRQAKKSKAVAEYHRARYRMFKAFEAQEEQNQTEWEAKNVPSKGRKK